MFYLTPEECVEFCSFNEWSFSDDNWPLIPPSGFASISFMIPLEHDRMRGIFSLLIHLLPMSGRPDDGWLLWPVNCYGNSAANYHLYYKLRQTYSDYRQLSQAPGHLFLVHEESDLLTFIQLTFLFEWDFHFVCEEWGALHNDGLLVLYARESTLFDEAKEALTRQGIEWKKGT